MGEFKLLGFAILFAFIGFISISSCTPTAEERAEAQAARDAMFKYKIGSEVYLKPTRIKGVIIERKHFSDGPNYKVVYYSTQNERQAPWLLEGELMLVEEEIIEPKKEVVTPTVDSVDDFEYENEFE